MAKLLPLEKYNGLNETKNKYKKLILNEKYLERNIMQLNDEFTQMIYGNNQNFNEIRITSDIDPKTKFKRDLAKENHYLSTKVRELETLIEEERLKREGYEAECNRLRSISRLPQSKELEKLRSQNQNKNKPISKQLSSKPAMQVSMNLDLDESFSDNLSINNDLLDLRFGESAYTQNDEGFSYEDMVRANHEFRAEIEDSRLQLEQTEQVEILSWLYKKVLDEEIRKNSEMERQLREARLVIDYGIDEKGRDFDMMRRRIEQLEVLLEEREMEVQAQKGVNRMLKEKIEEGWK